MTFIKINVNNGFKYAQLRARQCGDEVLMKCWDCWGVMALGPGQVILGLLLVSIPDLLKARRIAHVLLSVLAKLAESTIKTVKD